MKGVSSLCPEQGSEVLEDLIAVVGYGWGTEDAGGLQVTRGVGMGVRKRCHSPFRHFWRETVEG